MTELFTTIKFELHIDGVWVDLTPDVMYNPRPIVSGMGIVASGVSDRTGGIGSLSFSLNNSTSNSAGLLGYYSPRSNNFISINQNTIGLKVRLYFEYDGIRRYKFFGRIIPGGWNVITGQYGERRVDVVAENFGRQLSAHVMELPEYKTNIRSDDAIREVVKNMPVEPQGYDLDVGEVTFPTLFDITRENTMASAEMQKIAMSEFGRIYITGDGSNGETLRFDNISARTPENSYQNEAELGSYIPVKSSLVTDNLLLHNATDNFLLMSGDKLLLNNQERALITDSAIIRATVQYTKNYFNTMYLKTYPRSVDAAATNVLWSQPSGEPIALAAGEELSDIRGVYFDPNNPSAEINGIDMATPVSGTDWIAYENADATGTNYTTSVSVVATYGTADVRYTLKNNAGVAVYVTTLQARGRGVRTYATNQKKLQALAFPELGIEKVDLDFFYTASISDLNSIFDDASAFNTTYSVELPRFDTVTIMANHSPHTMMAFMALEPGRALTLKERVSGIGYDFFLITQTGWYINGCDFEIIDGKFVEWTCTMKFPEEL